ncbi:MAG: DUF2339 domain-containing protein [bacterium]|nr:DUF2339 domain-containing protein [Acidimicrobiia bacterium]MCY4650288.1 DUF2339 domain-containing protein [bacterium]
MTIALAFAGLVLGAVLLDGGGGFLFGGLVGVLTAQVLKLRRRIREIEATRATSEAVTHVGEPIPGAVRDEQQPPGARLPAVASTTSVEPDPRPRAEPAPVEVTEPSAAETPTPVQPPVAYYQRPSFGDLPRFIQPIKTWATTGNVPVKVGVLLSLIGLGFLLGVALEQGWITLSIGVRHILVALVGVLLLVMGWRARPRNAVYGLSLQGGGIGVLYLTTYTAHAVYDLLPASAAASAVIVVTVAAGVLAVSQDSRSLAVLGITGGFLAPILAYSDASDHILVFGFYVILSIAIVTVAWFKVWPVLNLVGLGFTVGLTAFWLLFRYEEEGWATTQPLIALLILLYMTIPLLMARRRPPRIGDPMTSPLLFGVPFIGLVFQFLLTDHFEFGPAISAASLAVIHAVFALVTHRFGKEARALVGVYWALAMTFVAIAAPLAFDAQFSSVVWALQGAMMVWVGLRHGLFIFVVGGGVLQLLSGGVFLTHLSDALPYPDGTTVLINGYFLGAALLAVTGLFTSRMVDRAENLFGGNKDVPWFFLFWGTGWWLLGGLMEIVGQVPEDARVNASLAFAAVSLGAMALAAPAVRWPRLGACGALLLPVLPLSFILALVFQDHPFQAGGWAAWIVAFGMYYTVLRLRSSAFPQVVTAMHVTGYWVLAVLLGAEVHWQVDQVASGVWPITAALATVLALVGGTLLARDRLSWPLAALWRTYLMGCTGPVVLVACFTVLLINLTSNGEAPPLTYLPLLNPLEILTVLAVVAALAWKRLAASEAGHPLEEFVGGNWAPGLAVTGIVLLTMTVARTVHHWQGVPFDLESMTASTTLQASLSIVWGLIGLSGMMVGGRSARRMVWVGGASLMGVVVVKLFLFDLSNTGTVARVVSFLGVGLLLLIVGYFAPVPPAAPTEPEHVETDGK